MTLSSERSLRLLVARKRATTGIELRVFARLSSLTFAPPVNIEFCTLWVSLGFQRFASLFQTKADLLSCKFHPSSSANWPRFCAFLGHLELGQRWFPLPIDLQRGSSGAKLTPRKDWVYRGWLRGCSLCPSASSQGRASSLDCRSSFSFEFRSLLRTSLWTVWGLSSTLRWQVVGLPPLSSAHVDTQQLGLL